jgi:hypothetical protein
MNMALIQQVSALLKFSHPVRVATVDESPVTTLST